jgi:hypothetical protein
VTRRANELASWLACACTAAALAGCPDDEGRPAPYAGGNENTAVRDAGRPPAGSDAGSARQDAASDAASADSGSDAGDDAGAEEVPTEPGDFAANCDGLTACCATLGGAAQQSCQADLNSIRLLGDPGCASAIGTHCPSAQLPP